MDMGTFGCEFRGGMTGSHINMLALHIYMHEYREYMFRSMHAHTYTLYAA